MRTLGSLNSFTSSISGPISLWSGDAPGKISALPAERDVTKPSDPLIAGHPIVHLTDIHEPTITIFRPAADKETGTAVMVCPGGGYSILVTDLEGTEVCAWLNSIGVIAVLLKYRVPVAVGKYAPLVPLQDAQRAFGIIRCRAKEWGINPKRIGVLGFSAGGHLAASLCNIHAGRNYPAVDAADQASSRPDFAILVYPAYLDASQKHGPAAVELPVDKIHAPPTFIVHAQDDFEYLESGVSYYLALLKAGIPVESHFYSTGGHGFGLRRTEVAATTWPDRALDWMNTSGWLRG